jgi:hypothetical protein
MLSEGPPRSKLSKPLKFQALGEEEGNAERIQQQMAELATLMRRRDAQIRKNDAPPIISRRSGRSEWVGRLPLKELNLARTMSVYTDCVQPPCDLRFCCIATAVAVSFRRPLIERRIHAAKRQGKV